MLGSIQTFPSHPQKLGNRTTSHSRQGKGRGAGQAPRRAGFVFARDRYRVEIVAPEGHLRWTPPGNRSRWLARSEPCRRPQKGLCTSSGRSRRTRSPILKAPGRFAASAAVTSPRSTDNTTCCLRSGLLFAGLDIKVSLHQTQPRPEQETLTRDTMACAHTSSPWDQCHHSFS